MDDQLLVKRFPKLRFGFEFRLLEHRGQCRDVGAITNAGKLLQRL